MTGYFELKKAAGTEFMFNFRGGNGEKVLTSETYVSKAGAENGIGSVKRNAATDGNYERKTASNGSPYFVLKAGNGETLGRSELYSSAGAMEVGIASVKANAPTAPTKDLT